MADRDHRWLLGGGIGSGKSEVRRLIGESGISTIDADSIGHDVLDADGAAYEEVAEAWPEAVENGRILRPVLGEIVFSNINQLRRLESITHPHIFGIITRRIEEIEGTVVVEIPLISAPLEGNWRTIVVDASDEVRLERATTRGMSADRARSVMAAQPGREDWLARADLVIPNHDDRESLEEAVRRVVPHL